MPAPTNGLILYWDMETLSGSNMMDRSGTGNHGTITGSPPSTIGKVGLARSFNGSAGTYVRVATEDFLSPPSTTLTLCAWIRPKSGVAATQWFGKHRVPDIDPGTTDFTIYAISTASTSVYALLSRCSNGNSHIKRRQSYASGTTVNSAGTWVHVAARVPATLASATIYINGVQQATVTDAAGTGTTRATLSVPFLVGMTDFHGGADEIRLYNRALSATEILAVYNDGLITGTQRGYFRHLPFSTIGQTFSRVRRSSGLGQDSYGDATFTETTTTGIRGFVQFAKSPGETVILAGKEIEYDAAVYCSSTFTTIDEDDLLLLDDGSSPGNATARYLVRAIRRPYHGGHAEHTEVFAKREVT